MTDPHRMVVVSITAVLFTGVLLFLYYKLFPKKINLLYLLIILSIFPLISILRSGTYESGDLSLHIKFAMQFFENLSQGNFSPEWIGRHCSGYGCPVYIFMFELPYYTISFFHLLGFSFINSAKLFLITTYIISGIGMFTWIKSELNEKAGFVAGIFYLYSPYHLIDLSFRVSIGELLSMAIMPFSFYFTKRLVETKSSWYFVLNSIFLGLLIISHQVTSFVCFGLLAIYGIIVWVRIKRNELKKLILLACSLILGVLITSYYWYPLISESKLIQYKIVDALVFHPISSFLYTPNRFGLLFQGHHGELYLNIGYVQWLIVIISLYFLFKRRLEGKEKHLMIFATGVFIIFFFMMQEISKPIWLYFAFLKNFQFTWRLMVEIIFIISLMAGILSLKIKNNIFIFLLCFITMLYTILNWGNRKMIPATDAQLKNETLFGEYPGGVDLTTPKWVDIYKPWVGKWPTTGMDVLSGKANVTQIKRTQTVHEYIVQVYDNSIIKENTFYYPGWILTANNKQIPIVYDNKSYPGVITFNLKRGIYKLNLIFTDTHDRLATKAISGLSILCLLISFFYLKFISNKS